MRSVIVIIFAGFAITVGLIIGSAAVTPVGDYVKDNVEGNQYDSTVDDIYTVVFQWSLLIIAGGAVVGAIVYALRRERRIGGGRL